MAIVYSGDNITFSDGSTIGSGWAGFKNRIINGDMRIDQRNAGASVTPTNSQYLVDRWQASLTQASKYTAQRNAGSVTPPTGFTNYLGFTSSSAYSVLTGDIFGFGQIIEGFNVADLGWGTASAQAVTLSFWVRSSLTGAFGGAVKNDGDTRNYPFTFTISAANTWEYKTVTIAGDTSGTWGSSNNVGINIRFSLGCGSTYSGTAGAWTGTNIWQPTGSTSVVGTNGATFYITGVQLEKGSTVTSFDYRPYGTELQLCQRYYFRVTAGSTVASFCIGRNATTSLGFGIIPFPVAMRIAPTALEQTGTAADYDIRYLSSTSTCTSVPAVAFAGTTTSASVQFTTSAVLTAGQGCELRGTNAFLGWSAEL